MKMLLFPIAVQFFCLFFSFFASAYAVETISANVSSSCTPDQTDCGLGCCPFAHATCCADGFECCQHGQTCIPIIGICLGLKDDTVKTALISSKATPLENLITACAPGTTTCGEGRCCEFPDATCCSDGEHCCPHGYRCDLSRKKCIGESYNELSSKWFLKDGLAKVSPLKMRRKSAVYACPGSNHICPSFSSCCINASGNWGCCPNPSLLSRISYGSGECCDTIFGYICCPDNYPHCNELAGCTN